MAVLLVCMVSNCSTLVLVKRWPSPKGKLVLQMLLRMKDVVSQNRLSSMERTLKRDTIVFIVFFSLWFI